MVLLKANEIDEGRLWFQKNLKIEAAVKSLLQELIDDQIQFFYMIYQSLITALTV